MSIEMLGEEVSTALTAPQRAAVALSSAQTRANLVELVKKSANIVAVNSPDGRTECHAAAMALVKARTTIERVGKAAREDATAFSKAVIQEEKALIGITAAEEARLLALRNAWDEARAAEKAEAERIEYERITRIHLRLADIRAVVGLAHAAKTVACGGLLVGLLAYPNDGFEEFTDEAATALAETIASVATIYDAKVAEEAERARIADEQDAERQRLAAERAELARQQAEAKAAQDKADAERRAQAEADAAELARQRAEMAAVQARLDADAKALRDAQAAEMKRQADELAAQRAAFEAEQAAARARTAAVIAAVKVEDDPADMPAAEPERAPLVLVADTPPWPDADLVIATAVGAVADRMNVSWSEAVCMIGAIDWAAIDPELLEKAV